MQSIKVKVLGCDYWLEFSGATSDDRSDMQCQESSIQDLAATISTDKDDGRGIPMGPGSFTPVGVAAAFEALGYEVGEVDTPPPDEDGGEA